MQGATHLLQLQVLVRDNGCRGRRLHRHIKFWQVEVVPRVVRRACRISACRGLQMLARPPWERKCGHVGYVEFWHREQRVVDLRHVELGGCVRDLELWNRRRQRRRGFGRGMCGDVECWGGGNVSLGHAELWHREERHVRYLDVQNR